MTGTAVVNRTAVNATVERLDQVDWPATLPSIGRQIAEQAGGGEEEAPTKTEPKPDTKPSTEPDRRTEPAPNKPAPTEEPGKAPPARPGPCRF